MRRAVVGVDEGLSDSGAVFGEVGVAGVGAKIGIGNTEWSGKVRS